MKKSTLRKAVLAEIINESQLLEIAHAIHLYNYDEIALEDYIKDPTVEELEEAEHIYEALYSLSKVKNSIRSSLKSIDENKLSKKMLTFYLEPYYDLEIRLFQRLDEISEIDVDGILYAISELDDEIKKEQREYIKEVNRRY